jgi:hypothetical protein
MSGWICCPFCHHNHLPTGNGQCPRCEQILTAGEAPVFVEEAVEPATFEAHSEAEALVAIDEPPVETVEVRTEGGRWASVTRWVARAVYATGAALGLMTLSMQPPRNRFFQRLYEVDGEQQWVFAGSRLDKAQLVLTGSFVLLGLVWMASAYFTASRLAGRKPVFSLRRLLMSWVPGARPSSVTVLHVTRKLAAIPSKQEKDRRWLMSAWWWVTLFWAFQSSLILAFGGTPAGWLFAEPGMLRLDVIFSAAQHLLTMAVVYDVGRELILAEHLVKFATRLILTPGPTAPSRLPASDWKQLLPEIARTTELVEPECPSCHRATNTRRCAECGSALWCGPYRVIRLLGERSYARTYLAIDTEGTPLAVKEISFSLAPNAAVLDAFEREAALLRALDHPQIPRFVDSFTEGSGIGQRFYLAQEFVAGRSLQVELAAGRFTEAEAKVVLRAILPVLEFLHSHSPLIIHRDVKPSNLLRRTDGTLMLIDFGAARAIGQTLMDATLVGTFGYMPPQQLAGQVDASTDLYALGATTLHLVTGRPPWELLRDDLSFALPQEVPLTRSFAKYLKRLIAPQRRHRFPSAAAALEALGPDGERPRWLFGLGTGR